MCMHITRTGIGNLQLEHTFPEASIFRIAQVFSGRREAPALLGNNRNCLIRMNTNMMHFGLDYVAIRKCSLKVHELILHCYFFY